MIFNINISESDPETLCKQYLANSKKHVLLLIDGLEDLFSQWLEKTCEIVPLKVLLQDIMPFVSEWSDRRVGFIILIRKDLVQRSITQNFKQFEAKYTKYQLRWSKQEILNLVGWVLFKANLNNKYCREAELKNWETYSFEQMKESLEPLWGLKLGTRNSKEAYSVNWVLSAISDFKGNIQARDIIRLLHEAAVEQKKSVQPSDRLLSASALKKALKTCGQEKIKEIKLEIPFLKKSLEVLQTSKKSLPLIESDLSKLKITDASSLEEFGLFFRDEKGEYYLPEIYRQGLNLNLVAKARPKVVNLMRKALAGMEN